MVSTGTQQQRRNGSEPTKVDSVNAHELPDNGKDELLVSGNNVLGADTDELDTEVLSELKLKR